MAYPFPTDPRHIRERIRRYERALRKELEARNGGDGYGKRYLPGDWYKEVYPDDEEEPYQYLTWSLALFHGDRR